MQMYMRHSYISTIYLIFWDNLLLLIFLKKLHRNLRRKTKDDTNVFLVVNYEGNFRFLHTLGVITSHSLSHLKRDTETYSNNLFKEKFTWELLAMKNGKRSFEGQIGTCKPLGETFECPVFVFFSLTVDWVNVKCHITFVNIA